MRAVPFEFNGTTYHLLLNGAALFDIYDQFGSEGSVFDPIKGNDRESFEAICWYLDKLAEQGELYRRFEGQTPRPLPRDDEFRTCLSPHDVTRARSTINEAIAAGFLQEEAGEPPKEVDLGLLELEKKTGES